MLGNHDLQFIKAIVILCIAISGPASADDVTLQSVMFDASYDVYKDLGTQGLYSKGWFLSGGSPLLYVVGEEVKVRTVFFESNPANWIDLNGYVVRGYVNGVLRFESDAPIDGETPHQASIGTLTGHPGATTIDWWQDFAIEWWLEDTNSLTKYLLGSSENNVFFVSLAPTVRWPTYYSVLYYACEGAKGQDGSDATALAEGIFVEFADRMVPRAQELLGGGFPIPMTYYKDWQSPNITISRLLKHHDSQCGSWAQFFMRCVSIAGFDNLINEDGLINEYATVFDKRPPIIGAGVRPFFVKNWDFTTQPSNPDEFWNDEYPYINIPTGVATSTFKDGNFYHWVFEDVFDTTGIPSQGSVSDPASIFFQHYVIKINDKYYDPSYGVTYTSLSNMDDTAIAAYAVSFGFWVGPQVAINELELMTDLNGDGNIDNVWVEVPVLYIQKNPVGTNELKEELTNPPR